MPIPSVTLSESGFSIDGTSVNWSDINQIRVFKLDRITTDELRFSVKLSSGVYVEVSEEQAGFETFSLALEEQFPSVAGWHAKVVHPLFARNEQVLYERT